jgi:hypothetical protein
VHRSISLMGSWMPGLNGSSDPSYSRLTVVARESTGLFENTCAVVIDVGRKRCSAGERLLHPSIRFVTLVEPRLVS